MTFKGDFCSKVPAVCILHEVNNGIMLPLGAGTVFDMSWALHSTIVPTSGGRYLRAFEDIDVVSQQRLPVRYTKLLLFLLSDNGQVFEDIDLIPVTEAAAACKMYVV